MRRAAWLLALAALPAAARPPAFELPPALREVSGLARSLADPSLLWAHNDSGDAPALYRLDAQGGLLSQVAVPAARAVDWEDIAAFTVRGVPALLVADTGDNAARRPQVTLYALRDPGREGRLSLLWRLDLRYPDGPRDCEAVAVDPRRREILLLSKRDRPPRLYRVPLPESAPGSPVTAAFAGTLELPGAAPMGWYDQPVALDVAPDGSRAVVATGRRAYVYERAPGGLLAGAPRLVPLPRLPQVEGAALAGDRLAIASEGWPARLAWLELPAAAAR